MTIQQGEIYWLQTESEIPHPHVVIQVGATSVVLCAITSNIRRVSMPGNVLLEAGEGGLPRVSVVEVGKTLAVEPSRLGAFIGTLDARRMEQISAGIQFIQTFLREPPPLAGQLSRTRYTAAFTGRGRRP